MNNFFIIDNKDHKLINEENLNNMCLQREAKRAYEKKNIFI